MSDTHGTGRRPADGSPAETVHEAYSFACMNCGHGWEESYEIAHRTDEHGHTSCVYYVGSRAVPSPLTRPTCGNCGGHLVRIMRSGRVSGARWEGPTRPARAVVPGGRDAAAGSAWSAAGTMLAPAAPAGEDDGTGTAGDRPARDEGEADHPHRAAHWLADLFARFHRRSGAGAQHHDRAA